MISSSPDMSRRHYKAFEDYNAIVHRIVKFENDNGVHKFALNKRQSRKFDQFLSTLQGSLEIFQEFQDDFLISNCYYEIGYVLGSKKKYEEALANLNKALEIFREIHGENHERTCDCYESIGRILSLQGRNDDAFIGYGKALAIRLKIFGENHIDTGRSYYNISLVQLNKRDYDGALISLQKSKPIFTRDFGEEDPRTVWINDLINICQICMAVSNKDV